MYLLSIRNRGKELHKNQTNKTIWNIEKDTEREILVMKK